MSSIFHPFVWLFEQFKSLFNSFEKEYNKLAPSVKDALEHSTGIIKIINDEAQSPVGEVITTLLAKYTFLDKDTLLTYLNVALEDADLAEEIIGGNLESTIQNLQNYLNSLKDLKLANALKSIRDLLAIALDPTETTWQKVALFGEWVYQHFFKQ